MTEPPVYLSAADVARRLGMDRGAVYNAVARGTLIPAAYAGERGLFDDAAIDAWQNRRNKAYCKCGVKLTEANRSRFYKCRCQICQRADWRDYKHGFRKRAPVAGPQGDRG